MVKIRKMVTVVEEILSDGGREAKRAVRKAAAVVVLENPFAGRFVDDLTPLIDAGEELGALLAKKATEALGAPAESYGKAAIVGEQGEYEHAAALLHPKLGAPLRAADPGRGSTCRCTSRTPRSCAPTTTPWRSASPTRRAPTRSCWRSWSPTAAGPTRGSAASPRTRPGKRTASDETRSAHPVVRARSEDGDAGGDGPLSAPRRGSEIRGRGDDRPPAADATGLRDDLARAAVDAVGAGRRDAHDPSRHDGARPAAAQSRLFRQRVGDPRSALGRPLDPRHRRGLARGRIRADGRALQGAWAAHERGDRGGVRA